MLDNIDAINSPNIQEILPYVTCFFARTLWLEGVFQFPRRAGWPGPTAQVAPSSWSESQTLSQLEVIGANYWHLGVLRYPKTTLRPSQNHQLREIEHHPKNRFLRCYDHLQRRSLQPFKNWSWKKLLGFLVEIHSEFRIHPPSLSHHFTFFQIFRWPTMWAHVFSIFLSWFRK